MDEVRGGVGQSGRFQWKRSRVWSAVEEESFVLLTVGDHIREAIFSVDLAR